MMMKEWRYPFIDAKITWNIFYNILDKNDKEIINFRQKNETVTERCHSTNKYWESVLTK